MELQTDPLVAPVVLVLVLVLGRVVVGNEVDGKVYEGIVVGLVYLVLCALLVRIATVPITPIAKMNNTATTWLMPDWLFLRLNILDPFYFTYA